MCQVLKVGSCAKHEAQSFGRGIYTLALGEEYYPQTENLDDVASAGDDVVVLYCSLNPIGTSAAILNSTESEFAG
jgi:hypothetical protein